MSSSSENELRRFMDLVGRQWPELLKDDCNRLDVVLPLRDTSSVGRAREYPSFLKMRDEFTSYLKASVNEHYDAFNESVGSYGITTETIADSQETLKEIRSNLLVAREILHIPLDVLMDMLAKSKQQEEMVEVIERIEEVKLSVETIETHINEKQFKKAQMELSKSFQTAEKYKLWQIPAMSSVKDTLDTQSRTLFDSICEEISSICYLKFGDLRNSVYEKSLKTEMNNLFDSDMDDAAHLVHRPLESYLNELNTESEGYAPGSEKSNFKQIKECLDVVKALGKLPEALQLLIDRTSLELQQSFNRAIEEVRIKYPDQLKMVSSSGSAGSKLVDINSSFIGSMNASILNDLFSGIFKKCAYAMQCHFAIKGILIFYGSIDQQVLFYDINTIWKRVEKEVSSIIYNYIVDESSHQIEVDTAKSTSNPWTKSRRDEFDDETIFEFSKISFNKSKSRKFDNIMETLFKNHHLVDYNGNAIFIENDAYNRSSTLVAPSVFNMSIIVNHFLYFISVSSLAFQEDRNIPLEFFDRIMHIVFLSQLESRLLYQAGQIAGIIYDNELNHEERSSVSFRTFFTGVLRTLSSPLFYREPYVNIILKILSKMVDTFYVTFDQVVPLDFLKMAQTELVPHWLQDEKVTTVSSQILRGEYRNNDQLKALLVDELDLCMKVGDESFQSYKMINERNLLSQSDYNVLVSLFLNLKRVLAWLPHTKRVVSETPKESNGDLNALKDTWKFMENDLSASTIVGDYQSFLTLNKEREKEFDSLIGGLQNLSLKIQLMIRYDLKTKTIWSISDALSKNNWMPNSESEEIEPHILMFNKELSNSSSMLSVAMTDKEKERVLVGLPMLVDKLLVSESRRIAKLNAFGITNLLFNIRVVKQMLRNVMSDPTQVNFSKSVEYYELFKTTDKGIVEKVKAGLTDTFTLDECKNMVRLIFSENMAKQMDRRHTSSFTPEKRYKDTLVKLEEEYNSAKAAKL